MKMDSVQNEVKAAVSHNSLLFIYMKTPHFNLMHPMNNVSMSLKL